MRVESEVSKLLKLREAYEVAHRAKVKAEDAKVSQERVVAEMLQAEGMKTAKFDELGVTVGARSTIRSRIFDKDKAIESFEQEALVDDMLEPGFRKAPLNELVRTRLENGQKLPDGVDFSRTHYITVTRKKEN